MTRTLLRIPHVPWKQSITGCLNILHIAFKVSITHRLSLSYKIVYSNGFKLVHKLQLSPNFVEKVNFMNKHGYTDFATSIILEPLQRFFHSEICQITELKVVMYSERCCTSRTSMEKITSSCNPVFHQQCWGSIDKIKHNNCTAVGGCSQH